MTDDKMRYLVRCALYRLPPLETYWAERKDALTDRASTFRDIINGQIEHPEQVIEFNPVENICNDVSEDFAHNIASYAFNENLTLSRDLIEFIEHHAGIEMAHGIKSK